MEDVPGLMRFRWNDKDAIAQIEVPLFETSKSSGNLLWNLLEKDEVDSITLLPGTIQTKFYLGRISQTENRILMIASLKDDGNPWDTVYPSVGYYIWTGKLLHSKSPK